MANFNPEEVTVRRKLKWSFDDVLEAGEQLTDVEGIGAVASKTVPAGKWAKLTMRIIVEIVDEDPNAPE